MGDDYRKKKVEYMFYKFFDEPNAKFIEKKHFMSYVQYTSKQRGWQPGEAKYKEMEDAMLKVWDSMRKHLGKDDDGKVSLDEWTAMCDHFAKNPSSPLEWLSLYCKVNFNLDDVKGDGVIDIEEYTSVTGEFGVSKSEAEATFGKLAKGKATISWQEFQELWKELYISNDPNAPGNFLFGPIEL